MILRGIKLSSNKTQKHYTTPLWKKYSKGYLIMNPVCVICGDRATTVDHILPVNQGGDMWNPNNHQPMCKKCHGHKSNSDKEYYGNPRY